jgi:hypothetical protein
MDRTTWEYRVVSLGPDDLTPIRERLADLGTDGWELVASHVLSFGGEPWVMVFKRPAEHRVIL